MNVGHLLQTGLVGINRTLDNTVKAASDHQGVGQPENVTQATGQTTGLEKALEGSVQAQEAAAATKVVTESEAVSGTHVDIHV